MINGTGNRMTQEIARQARMASNMAAKQTQISSGKRLQRASDDPVAAARVAYMKRVQANDAAREANINIGVTLTAQADGQLKSMSDLLARANELTVAGANEGLLPIDRATIASEMRAIADDIDALAATTSLTGGPLFPNGTGNAIRFDDDNVFVPVPSRQEIFETGGIAISQLMRDAAQAIASNNGTGIGTALTAVGAAVGHAADMQAKVGLNAARIDRIRETGAQRAISLSEERSRLEDTDLSSAIAELNGMTLTLEAAQAAFARINRRTLMDFLG